MSVSNEQFTLSSGPVPIDVYLPASKKGNPGVMILHGTLGLDPPFGADIVSFAEALAKRGIAAAIPHYFDSTGTAAGDEAFNSIDEHLPAWRTASGAALAFMAADSRFDPARIGMLGFSLGGHIALALAMARPTGTKIKSVVDFFAPTLIPALRGDWSAVPPVLIHHGTADPLSIENSRHLARKLKEEAHRTVDRLTFGKPATGPATDYQFIEYPGEVHGFKGAALAGSRDATVEFLDKHMK